MAKSIFDHLNGIGKNKTNWNDLSESDKKSWDDYMITRWLSMNPEYIGLVNDLQILRAGPITSKDYYNLLLYSLPKKNSYVKYIKKSRAYEENKELLNFLSSCYKISKRECLDMIDLFRTLKLQSEFDMLLQTYGIQEDKKIELRKELFND
jgi:hypothetical protein